MWSTATVARQGARGLCAGEPVQWALQAEQHGTGHALMQAMPAIPDDHLGAGAVRRCAAAACVQHCASCWQLAASGQLALLTVQLTDPTGYGRMLRDARGARKAIVEQKDATAAQRRCAKRNTGVMVLPRQTPARLAHGSAQQQCAARVLPHRCDAMAVKERLAVAPLVAAQRDRGAGSERQAAACALEACAARRALPTEAMLRGRHARGSCALRSARRSWGWGAMCSSMPNVLFEGRVELGDRARIGPTACCAT